MHDFDRLSVVDSINLTFATAGTGGFGVLDSSAAEYGAATQWVMTIFMILFGVNFNVYFLFYVKRFKEGMKSEEARAYLGIIAVCSPVDLCEYLLYGKKSGADGSSGSFPGGVDHHDYGIFKRGL